VALDVDFPDDAVGCGSGEIESAFWSLTVMSRDAPVNSADAGAVGACPGSETMNWWGPVARPAKENRPSDPVVDFLFLEGVDIETVAPATG
jgi:hypothetical protein